MIQSRPNEFRADEAAACPPGTEPKDRLKHHGDDAKRQADEIRHKAGEAAHQAGERMKDAGRQAKDQIASTARQTTSQVRERASSLVADQKNRLAEEVSVFGEALHCAGDTLDEHEDKRIGRYVHQAGDFCDSCARYLRDADANEMVRGVGEFTRRHPEVVLGGLFLAGVAAARFLKASDRHRERYDFDRGYEFDRDYGYMDTGRGLESGDIYGTGDTGYGDIGAYAGTPPYGVTAGADFETAGLAPRSRENRGQLGDADLVPDLPREEASLTRNEDVPDVTSPQPGSCPPTTPSGTFFQGTSGQADKTNPTATTDDDLNTIGRNEPSGTNPSKPR